MMRLTGMMLGTLAFVLFTTPAHAGFAGKITKAMLEATVDQAAKRSGRTLGGSARKEAIDEVKRLSDRHGGDVLKVVEDSGLELLEAAPQHGDDLLRIATNASPQARRALAMDIPELLPLAKRVGVEAIELEAKAPGQATHVFQVFGDDAGKVVAKNVQTEDLPRIIKYGELADSADTRKLLLDAYQKEGRSLFERVPPNVVLATGLSASMLYGTHEMTRPWQAIADVLRNTPDIVRGLMNRTAVLLAGITLVVILILLWRFRLMPWHKR
jgi:hypothetical protein